MRTALRWLVVLGALIAPASGRAEPAPTVLEVTLAAGTVSLDAREVPLRDVLRAVAARADLELSIHGDDDPRVTLLLDRVLLEDAIRRLVRWNYVLTDRRLIVLLLGNTTRETQVNTTGAEAEPVRVSAPTNASASPREDGIVQGTTHSSTSHPTQPGVTGAGVAVANRRSGPALPFTGTVSPAQPASSPAPAAAGQRPSSQEPGPRGPGTSGGVSAAEAARLAAAIQQEAADPEPDSLADEVDSAPRPTVRP